MEENTEKRELAGEKQEIRDEKGRFLPGVSGNPDGKPAGTKAFTTKVREALEKIADGKNYTYETAFIKAILKKAIIDQDPAIMRLIWNYLDGMPVQKTDITSDNEKIQSVQFEIISNEIKNKDNEDIGEKPAEPEENNS